jgi:hypothetical protein
MNIWKMDQGNDGSYRSMGRDMFSVFDTFSHITELILRYNRKATKHHFKYPQHYVPFRPRTLVCRMNSTESDFAFLELEFGGKGLVVRSSLDSTEAAPFLNEGVAVFRFYVIYPNLHIYLSKMFALSFISLITLLQEILGCWYYLCGGSDEFACRPPFPENSLYVNITCCQIQPKCKAEYAHSTCQFLVRNSSDFFSGFSQLRISKFAPPPLLFASRHTCEYYLETHLNSPLNTLHSYISAT